MRYIWTFDVFLGYLPQSWYRPAVIFTCLLHDRLVAKWRFQVSKLRLRLVTVPAFCSDLYFEACRSFIIITFMVKDVCFIKLFMSNGLAVSHFFQ